MKTPAKLCKSHERNLINIKATDKFPSLNNFVLIFSNHANSLRYFVKSCKVSNARRLGYPDQKVGPRNNLAPSTEYNSNDRLKAFYIVSGVNDTITPQHQPTMKLKFPYEEYNI